MENELERAKELNKEVQAFIWDHKDIILKGKKKLNGDDHPLFGTCYPAAWFLYELLRLEDIHVTVARRKMEAPYEDFNHTYCLIGERQSRLRPDDMEMVYWTEYTVLDPTADQAPDFKYLDNWKKSSKMIKLDGRMHKMSEKLMELWEQRELLA